MENALVTCTGIIKVTFSMSDYVSFKENYSDEEKENWLKKFMRNCMTSFSALPPSLRWKLTNNLK